MRLLRAPFLLTLLLPACTEGTSPPPEQTATALRLDQPSVTMQDGGSATLAATVLDQNGRPMDVPAGMSVEWSSSAEAIASVDTSGRVSANRPGSATIRATLGTLSAEAAVTVQPVPSTLLLLAPQDQQGPAGAPLPQPISSRILDRHGDGVPGVTVIFSVVEGAGSVAPASVASGADGSALTVWTLGTAAGPQLLQVSVAGLTGSPAGLRAQAVAAAPAVIAEAFGNNQSGGIGAELAAPVAVRVLDAFGNPVAGAAVSWVPDPASGAADPPESLTDTAGTASTRWRLGTLSGTQRLLASVGGAATFAVVASASPGPVATLQRFSGDGQSGFGGQLLSAPLVARVRDAFGNPVPGVTVAWTPDPGDGAAEPASSTTDGQGLATTRWRLGMTLQRHRLRVSYQGLTRAFEATITPLEPLRLLPLGGEGQARVVGSPLLEPFAAQLVDAAGIEIPGAGVTWSAVSGGGRINQATTTTDAQGRITATAVLGTTAGENRYRVEHRADVALEFAATATPGDVVRLEVDPDTLRFEAVGQTRQLSARGWDGYGNPRPDPVVTWMSRNPRVAEVSGDGLVRATGGGVTHVVGTVSFYSDSARVYFDLTGDYVRVGVSPRVDTIAVPGDSVRLSATLYDESGNGVPVQSVLWDVLSGPLQVSSTGLVRPAPSGIEGTGRVRVRWGELADTATVVVQYRTARGSPADRGGFPALAVGGASPLVAGETATPARRHQARPAPARVARPPAPRPAPPGRDPGRAYSSR